MTVEDRFPPYVLNMVDINYLHILNEEVPTIGTNSVDNVQWANRSQKIKNY